MILIRRWMLRCFCTIVAGWAIIPEVSAQDGSNLPLRQQVARLAQPLIEEGKSVGIAVGIVDADGQTHHFGFGRVVKGEGRVPDQDTLFELGSVTKCFTGILLADMVLHNEVRLNEPVQNLVPKQVGIPRVSGQQMTLEELATYSSGLPRVPANFGRTDAQRAQYSREEMFEFLTGLARRERGAGPQRHYLYSNLGFALLGQCLADRANEPIRPLIVNRVARRLGMESTVFTPGPQLASRVAAVYDQGRRVAPWETGVIAPAGMLRSSTRDMVKFIEANVGRTESPLQRAIELAQKPRYETGTGNGSTVNHEIGLAWFIEAGSGLVHHDGATAGSSSNVVFHPGRRIGVVVLMNQSKSPAQPLSMQIMKLLHPDIDLHKFNETHSGEEESAADEK